MKNRPETVKLINSFLLTIGFQPSVLGFEYVKSAISEYERCGFSMKRTCATIGETAGKSPRSVERDISTAIKNAQARGWLTRLNEIVDCFFVESDKPIKPKEFIAIASNLFCGSRSTHSHVAFKLSKIKKREAYDVTDEE